MVVFGGGGVDSGCGGDGRGDGCLGISGPIDHKVVLVVAFILYFHGRQLKFVALLAHQREHFKKVQQCFSRTCATS